jgi:L,D-transpeptidase catalytic domain/Putative peptidoglycan binding domain
VGLDTFQRSDRHDPGDVRLAGGAMADDRRRPRWWIALAVLLGLAMLAFLALAFLFSRPGIVVDSSALAQVQMPLTGGTRESVTATGPGGRTIPIALRDGQLWPQVKLASGEPVSVEVVVRRAGWVGWLAGGQTSKRVSFRTPSAPVSDRYVTLAAGAPLRLSFDQPVRRLAYGQPEHLRHDAFKRGHSVITLAHVGPAGSIEVAAAPRTWERLPAPLLVSWFPPGTQASAVVSPQPGTPISPATPISVTFSRPVASVLGPARPRLQPAAAGSWHTIDSHTIVFHPAGYGFGLDTPVALVLPHTVRLIGGQTAGAASVASWTVPPGSNLRAQQLLAQLGYLPLTFASASPVANTPTAQERAAVDPPAGSFSWRYPHVPGSLDGLWQPGAPNVVMRGAVMAFENAHGLETDGVVGPSVWRALIAASIGGQRDTAGYTYVMVSEGSPESLTLWNDGSTRLTAAVNTGIPAAPTEQGTFPVYEHIPVGTMSGTNPDGSHYEDPGIPWISYFNGGDALHGFDRASYGFPQSLGCVEMPPATAGEVWPYTPIGTLVHIE